MRISDWSSDVCSSDLRTVKHGQSTAYPRDHHLGRVAVVAVAVLPLAGAKTAFDVNLAALFQIAFDDADQPVAVDDDIMPFGALLALAGHPVLPAFRRRDAEFGSTAAVLDGFVFGIEVDRA